MMTKKGRWNIDERKFGAHWLPFGWGGGAHSCLCQHCLCQQ